MGKKSTVKCNEIKPKEVNVHNYEVIYNLSTGVEKMRVTASYIATEDDYLVVFNDVDGSEVQTGAFKDWIAFYKV
jgi:hypothetical protein